MNFFENLDVPLHIKNGLKGQFITKPTEVQAKAIPPAIDGRDILATSQTGTGKTLAFLLPLSHHLAKDPQANALILAPTRELALQIQEVAKGFTMSTALIIGGDDMGKQVNALRRRPKIIIATPGRLIDHLKRGTVLLRTFSFLVLDETDRMLDMGFVAAINNIMAFLPSERQTMMFSATMPESINKLAQTYLKNPARIAVGSTHEAHESIEQNHIKVALREKLPLLLKELEKNGEDTSIIFVKTKHNADKLADKLKAAHYKANALHGNLSQSRRRQVLEMFRDGKVQILVATDIAARGIDVSHIKHVINYDIPFTPEEYIHRVGRTGRAGASGRAISFVSPEDNKKWAAVCNMLAGKQYKGSERRANRIVKKIDAFLAEPIVIEAAAAPKKLSKPAHKKVQARTEFDFAKDAALTDEQGVKKPHNKYAEFSKKTKEDDMKDELFERVLKDKNKTEKKPRAARVDASPKEIKADGRPSPFDRFKNKLERIKSREKTYETAEKKYFDKKKDFGDRKPFGEKKAFGERKTFGDKKHFESKKTFSDRKPYKKFDDKFDKKDGFKKPFKKEFRKDFKKDGERDFKFKKEGFKKEFKKSFGDKKPFGAKKSFGNKKSFGGKKPFGSKPAKPGFKTKGKTDSFKVKQKRKFNK